MEITKHKEIKYELVSEDGVTSFVLNKKRVLVGSGESCDLVLPPDGAEGVHSVVEVTANGLRAYDMNTVEGTFVNGQTAIVKDAVVGDQVCFGSNCYTIDSFDAGVTLDKVDVPAILLDQNKQDIPPLVPLNPKRVNKTNKPLGKKGSFDKVEYPLANYPNADRLDYIFEQPDNIKNVLHYDLFEKSIEVTVSIGSQVFSIDYLNASNSSFYLCGDNKPDSVTLPYLGKNEQVVFLDHKQDKYFIQKIDGFDFLNLSESTNKEILDNDSLAVFLSDQVKVFIRLSDAPPRTLVEPFINNDKIFWKYFSIVMAIVFIFLFFIGIMDVNEELKDKKAPQKLASILYKKPVLSISVDKTKNANKKIAQKASRPTKKVKAKSIKSKTFRKKSKAKSVARKKSLKTKSKKVRRNKKVTKSSRKSKGSVDTYKAVDFAASLPSSLTKTSDFSKVSNEQQENFEYSANGPSAKNIGDDVKLRKIDNNSDDISKSASKDLSDTGALSDFQSEKVMATAGIPSRTVVLGGMDPDTIRKILMDHLSQFRFCYQKELDKVNKEFSGRITLNFVIGASGYVTRAGVKESSMPQIVRSCVVNVLKGIPFPAPRGGGVVEVTQPMNFYPKQ
jgi:hypothetical protein